MLEMKEYYKRLRMITPIVRYLDRAHENHIEFGGYLSNHITQNHYLLTYFTKFDLCYATIVKAPLKAEI